MNRIPDRQVVRRVVRAAFALVSAAGLVTAAWGAAQPRVENPHGKFREDCQLCHSSKAWNEVKVSPKFDHSKYGFALTGAHATSNCMGCHRSLDFAQSRTQCASCHADPHRGEMGTDCAHCHGARSFVDRGPMVRAHQLTRFPLTGGHASLDCESCHKPAAQGQLQFVGTQADCKSCHMAQYDATRNPNHLAGGFSTECQSCHTSVSWSGGGFNHDLSGFPLTGAHRQVACTQCHVGGNFKAANPACFSCHADRYAAAQPPHDNTSFPTNACGTCHTTTAWNTPFNHSVTAFPLTGAHVSAACTSCHGDGVYAGKSTACYSCHASTYASATPPHTPSAYPTAACATCHGTSTWSGALFNHNTTAFPLTGAHVGSACTSCHGDGVYAGKSTACYSCHASTYASATPPHTPTAYPTSACATCHGTTTWSGAVFNHNTTAFPLTGAHVSAACTSCHGDGVYAGKSTACYSCHQPEYSTASPAHSEAFYPNAQCGTCHTTSAWTGGKITVHDASWFKIYSGKHRGQWTDCTDCHTTPSNPAAFTCIACHQHSSKTNVDNQHQGRSGYSYTATSCYSCHRSV